jgi:hypothetical protein
MRLRRLVIGGCMAIAFSVAFGVTSQAGHNGCLEFRYRDIALYNGASGEYHDAYQNESINEGDSWSEATIVNLFNVGGYGENDQINAFNANYGNSGWVGVTMHYLVTSCTLQHSRVQLNEYYLANHPYYAKAFVACHEMGHALGLEHRAWNEPTCMKEGGPGSWWDPPFPDQHDFDAINEKYESW